MWPNHTWFRAPVPHSRFTASAGYASPLSMTAAVFQFFGQIPAKPSDLIAFAVVFRETISSSARRSVKIRGDRQNFLGITVKLSDFLLGKLPPNRCQ